MLACAVVALLGNITANRMASKVARDTTESMRFDLFDKTLNLSARQTDGFAHALPCVKTFVGHLQRAQYDRYDTAAGYTRAYAADWRVVVTFMVEPVLALVLLATMPFLVLPCRARG